MQRNNVGFQEEHVRNPVTLWPSLNQKKTSPASSPRNSASKVSTRPVDKPDAFLNESWTDCLAVTSKGLFGEQKDCHRLSSGNHYVPSPPPPDYDCANDLQPDTWRPWRDQTLRPCIDYRSLNEIVIKNRYPLPLISSAFELLDEVFCALKAKFPSAPILLLCRTRKDNWSWK